MERVKNVLALVLVFPLVILEPLYKEVRRAWRNFALVSLYKIHFRKYKEYWKNI